VTRQADWFSLLLVTGVMVTGFASAHGFGSESFMALLHVLFGEAILICLPFTRLSHAILIPFTRAYMGSESIGVRRTCDW
jgi:nitrate reductase gamma subunit